MTERCMCGDPYCPTCGPLQGYGQEEIDGQIAYDEGADITDGATDDEK